MASILILVALAFSARPMHDARGASEHAVLAPRFEYQTVVGCGDVFLHAVNSSETEILRIDADLREDRTSRKIIDLANAIPEAKVSVSLYRERQINRPNCSDVSITEIGKPPVKPDTWQAIGGRLVIERGPKGAKPEEPWLFLVRLRLEGAVFRNSRGETVEMKQPFAWEGYAGWQAG